MIVLYCIVPYILHVLYCIISYHIVLYFSILRVAAGQASAAEGCAGGADGPARGAPGEAPARAGGTGAPETDRHGAQARETQTEKTGTSRGR